jgi:hypothetical protein
MFRTAATGLVLFLIASSAVKADEYRRATDMERVRAYCEEVGASAERGEFAFGSPLFVALAGIGNAIGNGVAHQRAYDNCMTVNGYVRSDAAFSPDAGAAAQQSVNPQPRYVAERRAAAPSAVGTIRYKRYKLGE